MEKIVRFLRFIYSIISIIRGTLACWGKIDGPSILEVW